MATIPCEHVSVRCFHNNIMLLLARTQRRKAFFLPFQLIDFTPKKAENTKKNKFTGHMGGCDARTTYPPSPPEKPMPSINWLPFTHSEHRTIVVLLRIERTECPKYVCHTLMECKQLCDGRFFVFLLAWVSFSYRVACSVTMMRPCRCCCCWCTHFQWIPHTNNTGKRQSRMQSNALFAVVSGDMCRACWLQMFCALYPAPYNGNPTITVPIDTRTRPSKWNAIRISCRDLYDLLDFRLFSVCDAFIFISAMYCTMELHTCYQLPNIELGYFFG